MYIIRSDTGQPLRDELAKSPHKILTSAFPEFMPKPEATVTAGSSTATPVSLSDEGLSSVPAPDSSSLPSSNSAATSDGYFQGLALVKTMVKLIPGWLQSNAIVFETLVLLWKSPARITRLCNERELDLVQVSFMQTSLSFSLCMDFFDCM